MVVNVSVPTTVHTCVIKLANKNPPSCKFGFAKNIFLLTLNLCLHNLHAAQMYFVSLSLSVSHTHTHTHILVHTELRAYGLFNVTAMRGDCIDFPHGWCLLTWGTNPHLHTRPAPPGDCSPHKVKHTLNCLLKRDRRRRGRGEKKKGEEVMGTKE